MATELFSEFAPLIRSMSLAELDREIEEPVRLRLDRVATRAGTIDIAYAPFDFVNPQARIVIVGLTPGRQQMRAALHEVRRLLVAGSSLEAAAQGAKIFASFAGPMRRNLVDLLDYVGVATLLGVSSTASLWNGNGGIVHFTSALRYPVFLNHANYSGAPDMLRTPVLAAQLRRWLAMEMRLLSGALFVPLGPKVSAALGVVARETGINPDQVLSGLPHSSGANAERIAYFLERKPRSTLSTKTNPARLDAAREKLLNQTHRLRG
jgi:hypothetical protein